MWREGGSILFDHLGGKWWRLGGWGHILIPHEMETNHEAVSQKCSYSKSNA
jgi:hypothetical protein